MPGDRCDFDTPIPSSKLQSAINKAFDTLGSDARNSLIDHLRSKGINLSDGSQLTLNEINAALVPIFSSEAAALLMEMIWNLLED